MSRYDRSQHGLANVYLHRLDRAWRGACGTLVRYADDLVVMCRSHGQAVAAFSRVTSLLADPGLEPKQAKTRIVQLTDGGQGVDFLGFHHRLVHSRAARGTRQITYLARWPSLKPMQHARDRIRFMTMRARLAAAVEQVVQVVNLFLRGWAGYFRYGNSAYAFDKIRNYAVMRLALFLAKRHQRPSASGFAQVYRSPDTFGLISLNGIVAAPRPNWAWRAVCGRTECTVRRAGAGNGTRQRHRARPRPNQPPARPRRRSRLRCSGRVAGPSGGQTMSVDDATQIVTSATSEVWGNHVPDPDGPEGFTFRTTYPTNSDGVEVMLERWDAGTEEPPHFHPGDDMTVVVEGRMSVQFYREEAGSLVPDAKRIFFGKGDVGYIRARRIHDARYIEDCQLVYVHNGAFEFHLAAGEVG
jgi:hypothetical protein